MTALRTHSPAACDGTPCVVHNPSDHHMKDWPITYRLDRAVRMPDREVSGAVVAGPVFVLAERGCPHGVGHPDPDAMDYARREGGEEFASAEGVHGCDGCCRTDAPHQFTPQELAPIAEWYDTHSTAEGDWPDHCIMHETRREDCTWCTMPPPDAKEAAHAIEAAAGLADKVRQLPRSMGMGQGPADLSQREVSDEELDEVLKGPLRFLPDDHPEVLALRQKFFDALDAQDSKVIVIGEGDDEDPAELIRKFDAAMAAGEPVMITRPPEGWAGLVKAVCGHCKQPVEGFGFAGGETLCHTGSMPPWTARRDCYRLVTVYKHTLGGGCWCKDLSDEEVGQLHTAEIEAGTDWHAVAAGLALTPWDEPLWVALTPREKMDGTHYPVEVAVYHGDGEWHQVNGPSLDDEVLYWADMKYPRHPAKEAR
jgi:hypothetical protein